MGRVVLVLMLVFGLGFMNPQAVQAELLTTSQLVKGQESLSQKALKNLEDPQKAETLKALGISKEEAAQRIAGLSDHEIERMINGEFYEAGGSVITILLLIIIIVLLVR